MLGVIFTQLVTSAYACPRLLPGSGTAAAEASPAYCPEAVKKLVRNLRHNPNCCQAYCTAGQQIDTHANSPVAAVAPQPALTIRVADAATLTARGAWPVPAPNATPPPLLLCSRFLI